MLLCRGSVCMCVCAVEGEVSQTQWILGTQGTCSTDSHAGGGPMCRSPVKRRLKYRGPGLEVPNVEGRGGGMAYTKGAS